MMIDLAAITANGEVRNLAGKDRGLAARLALHIDKLDHAQERVTVTIPEYVYSVTDSFVLGLFSQSVLKLGGLARFFEVFSFEASPAVLKQIQGALERAAAPRPSFSF